MAPEHELVSQITTEEQKAEVETYVLATAKRSERERMADVKTISGVFTGAYAKHPFTNELIPGLGWRLCNGRLWNRSRNGCALW